MNFLRKKLSRGRRNGAQSHASSIDIAPGQVEEAVHFMQFTGEIDLNELTFTSDAPQYHEGMHGGIQSFLDIAVLEVPEHCTSRTCDLSRFGIGTLTHLNGATFLGLCQGGRLIVDHNIFHGLHTQLMIPTEGPMPTKLPRRSAKFDVLVKNRSYDVMIANCNDSGRHVHLSGQVVFDLADDTPPLTAKSLGMLTCVAFFVCLLFSLLSIKIDRGTRADWEYQHLQNLEATRETEETQRLQSEEASDANDDGDENAEQEQPNDLHQARTV